MRCGCAVPSCKPATRVLSVSRRRLNSLTVVVWVCVLVAHAPTFVVAQSQQATIVVEVRAGDAPVAGAGVTINGVNHATVADGRVVVQVSPGNVEVAVARQGFVSVRRSVVVRAGEQQAVVIHLEPQPTIEEEVTVVATTRTDQRIDDLPMRVEVLGREEIEEKMLMTPGDIVMMLNEMGGMRVQATSPSLGAASVRIQGMRGRYTRFLSDGLPLFGEQVGALGLLQIPPMDLGQVEVIKGVASSLYGAGAMGGVVNLISRRPGPERAHEALINQSTRGATDAVLFLSGPVTGRWGMTMLGSGHWQRRTDVNDDAWADLPGYSRAVVRPRLFWDGGNGSTFFATTGLTLENRAGGTLPGATLQPTGTPYGEALDTIRFDMGALGQRLLRRRYVMTFRASYARQQHDHQFGEVREHDRHHTGFAELAIRGNAGRHTWVAGLAVEHEAYRPSDLPQFAHTFTVPGAFVQDDLQVAPWFSLSASGRLDHHSQYGVFFSPRIAALLRSGGWSSRLSVGTGFFGPSALTEETEAAGLTRLTIPRALVAEEGRSASMDLSRTDGPASYTVTLFASRVAHPVDVDRSGGLVLANLADATTNIGVELLGTVRRAPFALTASYTYVQSRESEGVLRLDAPLTPRHSAGIVGMWEREDVGRVGVEWYFTGVQRLEENPFRAESEPYMIVGLLAERQFGRIRLFVNGENLTGVRQTRWDPLLRPSRAADGRWTVDAWAPLEGRNVNGGVRLRF
jgi:outer membrane receptor for ferrienterochelin and colicins